MFANKLQKQAEAQWSIEPFDRMQVPVVVFADDELILRDELAIDRTLLANERTVLAYLRSAVALVLAGVSIMHFAHEGWFRAIGIVSVPAGLFVGVFGVRRYRRMDRGISVIRRRSQARADRQRPAGRGAP